MFIKCYCKTFAAVFESKYSRMDEVKFVKDSLLKNLNGYGLLKQNITLQFFLRLSSTNFTWSILEYFVPCIYQNPFQSFGNFDIKNDIKSLH